MDSLDALYGLLDTLPKGYISKKKINWKEQFYLQWKEKGKVISRYVRPSQVKTIQGQIQRRKEIEKLIKSLKAELFTPAPKLSSSSRLLTGSVMSGGQKVASFDHGILTEMDSLKAPLYIVRTKDLASWLASRAIDSTRHNSSLLKEAMEIKEDQDSMVALYAHGAAIGDDFWFKPAHSSLKYEQVKFKNDYYASLALCGVKPSYEEKPLLSPELTTRGTFEKGWKLIKGEWWLYKKENSLELFSEYFCFLLGTKLGFSFATYEIDGSFIRTKNFASELNFEPVSSLCGEDDSYQTVFSALLKLSKDIARDYLKLIWFDSLIGNIDRHNENCGLLRKRSSGKIVSLAPDFDNNAALFARGVPSNVKRDKDPFIGMFQKFIISTKEAEELFLSIQFPILTKDIINDCLSKCPSTVENDKVIEFVMSGYQALTSLKGSLTSH